MTTPHYRIPSVLLKRLLKNSAWSRPVFLQSLNACALIAAAFLSVPSAIAKDEYRIYFIGNSLTDQISYDKFVELAKTGGERVEYGRLGAPGLPIDIFWQMRDQGGFSKSPYGNWGNALSEFQWDALTLQPFGRPFESQLPAALDFARELAKKSPEGVVYIYAQWPDRGARSGMVNSDATDWEMRFIGEQLAHGWVKAEEAFQYAQVAAKQSAPLAERLADRSMRHQYETFVHEINRLHLTERPARLIPVGHVMQLLGQKMRAGQVPGYSSPWDFYTDAVHVSNDASYLVALTFYATIFGKSPVGLPVGGYQKAPGGGMVDITPELARVFQESVWEVVASHPLTGVTSDEPLAVATPALPVAYVGMPFLAQLLPAFGKAPHTWSVVGTLPEGGVLSDHGLLSGTFTQPGEHPIEFVVRDASGTTAKRPLTLRVQKLEPLAIPEPRLPAMRVGDYLSYHFGTEGGIPGASLWTVKDGQLPPGLRLDIDGRLWGAPGVAGDFSFTLEATNGDGPAAQKKTLAQSVSVAPLPSGASSVAVARRLDAPPPFMSIHDKNPVPDLNFWDFRYPVEKLVIGEKATVRGKFDIAYHGDTLYVAMKVEDATDGTSQRGDQLDNDYFALCIDGYNNREAIYNADDRFFPVKPGIQYIDRKLLIGDAFSGSARAVRIEGGWFVNFSVKSAVAWFRGTRGNWQPGQVLGLDLIIADDAKNGVPASMVVWQGTKDNATDPSKFGTVVLGE